jgi:hypothetical protein
MVRLLRNKRLMDKRLVHRDSEYGVIKRSLASAFPFHVPNGDIHA